ncbi:T9SS type A sorting domain-containing protein, partial [Aquimarina brevivitae]
QQIQCYGEQTLVPLQVTVSGGVRGYSYQWYESSNPSIILYTTDRTETLSAGTYVVVVTDTNGNQATVSYEVTQPEELNISFTKTDVLCFAGNNGAIDVNVTGGTGSYTIFWNTGQTTEDISNLIAGDYTITVRDENFCEAIRTITITQPTAALSIINEQIEDATGFGLTNGNITVSVTGGTLPYSYQWVDTTNTVVGTSSNSLENIGAGDYYLTITDANGCSLGPVNYTVDEPLPLEVALSERSIGCFGEEGGFLATVTGGVPPYTYQWTDANNNVISNTEDSGAIVAGTYNIEVIDNNGNQTTLTDVLLAQPDLLEIIAINITDVSCYNGSDGSIEVVATGGTGNYIYTWSNSGSTTNRIEGLVADTYAVTITDENGCFVTNTAIIVEEPTRYDVIAASLVRPSGETSNDGSIAVEIIGGVAPYQYTWTAATGAIIQQEINQFVTNNTVTSLSEGTYSLTVTDATGCVLTETYSLADPGELLVTIQQVQAVSCYGASNGIIEVVTIGGAGGNNFEWFNATDGSLVGNEAMLSNVPAGSYYVVVSNAEGVQEQSAIFEVTQPDAIDGEVTIANRPTCFGTNTGVLAIAATGGNGNYEYRYRFNSGTYSDWISFNTGASTTINELSSGFYQIQLRDTNSCFYAPSGSVEVFTIALTQPDPLRIVSAQLNTPTGFGLTNGSIQAVTQGGTAPYLYQWFSGGNELSQTTNVVSNIGAGEYRVIVTDANGCQTEQEYTLGQPDQLIAQVEAVNVISCFGETDGSLRAIQQGGVGPLFTYQWYEASSNTLIGNQQLLENISAGVYYVVITDTNGNRVQSEPFEVVEPAALSVSLDSDYINCGDGADWTIEAMVIGGTAPYQYRWNTGATTNTIAEVPAGNYTVVITDARGCSVSEEVILTIPEPLSLSFSTTIPTCFEGCDGQIDLEIQGGAPPYTYQWSTDSNNQDLVNSCAGEYTVVVTDAKGCQISETITLANPEPIALELGEDITLCAAQSVTLDASIADGIAYSWSSTNGFTSTSAVIEVNESGIYEVTATDNNGCSTTDSIFIDTTADPIEADFIASTQVFVGEQFVVVNISEPQPDRVVWELPAEAILIAEDDNFAEIIINEPGEYEVSLYIESGLCTDVQTKRIVVVEKEFDEDETDQDTDNNTALKVEYSIYPNPTSDGRFSIDVKLHKPLPVSAKIFTMVNNHQVASSRAQGRDQYVFDFNLSGLPSGIYFILLETQGHSQVRKLMIE